MVLNDDGLLWVFLRVSLVATNTKFYQVNHCWASITQKNANYAIFTAFYSIWRHFTALQCDERQQYFMELEHMCVLGPNTHFLAVFKTISYDMEEQHLKSVKNVILTAFNGVKWYHMTSAWLEFLHECVLVLNCNCQTICLPEPLFLNSFWLKNAQKCQFYGKLRHFTVFSPENPNRIFSLMQGNINLGVYNTPE